MGLFDSTESKIIETSIVEKSETVNPVAKRNVTAEPITEINQEIKVEPKETTVVTSTPKETAISTPSTADLDKFEQSLIEVVADKTGYPMEILELDMNLETDLGIDSIKKVEILYALKEYFPGIDETDLDEDTMEEVGQLSSLQEIINYVKNSSTESSRQPGNRTAC